MLAGKTLAKNSLTQGSSLNRVGTILANNYRLDTAKDGLYSKRAR